MSAEMKIDPYTLVLKENGREVTALWIKDGKIWSSKPIHNSSLAAVDAPGVLQNRELLTKCLFNLDCNSGLGFHFGLTRSNQPGGRGWPL